MWKQQNAIQDQVIGSDFINNPFHPRNFAKKHLLLVEPPSGHCLAKKRQDSCPPKTCLKVMHFMAFCFRCNIHILPLNGSSGMHRKKNVVIAFGFKSDTAVSQTFTFALSISPYIFCTFLALFYFFFCKLTRLDFSGKSFWESFQNRMIKCKEVQLVKTRRLSKFGGQLFMVICIFVPLDLTVLILEWSPPAQVRQQICP